MQWGKSIKVFAVWEVCVFGRLGELSARGVRINDAILYL
jgi:hypothetical protein